MTDLTRRWHDLAVAGHTGDIATARRGLTDADPTARRLALGALDRLGVLDDAEVITAFDDPDSAVRRRAVALCVARPAIDLAPLLADADPKVVEVAAWVAGERLEETLVPTLAALATGADDALVREAAVAALGAIGHPDGLPAILIACGDKPAVRRRAVLALAPFEGPEVDAALDRALGDRDWQVRQAAEDVAPDRRTS